MAESVLNEIKDAIIGGEVDGIKELIQKALDQKITIGVILEKMTEGIRFVGIEFEAKRLFLPDMVLAGEAMKEAFDIVRPQMESSRREYLGRVVIGTVAGDIHDIGKNIIISFLMGAGFEVHDLGVDVAIEDFVKAVNELKPDLVGASAYMATTAPALGEVEKALRGAGVRDKIKLIIGGAAVSEGHVAFYHADAYGKSGPEAVDKALGLIQSKKGANR